MSVTPTPAELAILERLERIEKLNARYQAMVEVLLDGLTIKTHLTLNEIVALHARMGEGISKTSVRRRFGQWLETIPGTRLRGVPRDRVINGDGWVPMRTVAAARRRERKAKATA